jgi:hypothetical protein
MKHNTVTYVLSTSYIIFSHMYTYTGLTQSLIFFWFAWVFKGANFKLLASHPYEFHKYILSQYISHNMVQVLSGPGLTKQGLCIYKGTEWYICTLEWVICILFVMLVTYRYILVFLDLKNWLQRFTLNGNYYWMYWKSI